MHSHRRGTLPWPRTGNQKPALHAVAGPAWCTAIGAGLYPGPERAIRSPLCTPWPGPPGANLLGQNTPAIAVNEAEYGEMWAQDAAAMFGYAATAATATEALLPFEDAPLITNPGGLLEQAVAAFVDTRGFGSPSGRRPGRARWGVALIRTAAFVDTRGFGSPSGRRPGRARWGVALIRTAAFVRTGGAGGDGVFEDIAVLGLGFGGAPGLVVRTGGAGGDGVFEDIAVLGLGFGGAPGLVVRTGGAAAVRDALAPPVGAAPYPPSGRSSAKQGLAAAVRDALAPPVGAAPYPPSGRSSAKQGLAAAVGWRRSIAQVE